MEEFSKATIRLDCGLYDAEVKKRGDRFFAFRLKLGVPFNTMKKKKDE